MVALPKTKNGDISSLKEPERLRIAAAVLQSNSITVKTVSWDADNINILTLPKDGKCWFIDNFARTGNNLFNSDWRWIKLKER